MQLDDEKGFLAPKFSAVSIYRAPTSSEESAILNNRYTNNAISNEFGQSFESENDLKKVLDNLQKSLSDVGRYFWNRLFDGDKNKLKRRFRIMNTNKNLIKRKLNDKAFFKSKKRWNLRSNYGEEPKSFRKTLLKHFMHKSSPASKKTNTLVRYDPFNWKKGSDSKAKLHSTQKKRNNSTFKSVQNYGSVLPRLKSVSDRKAQDAEQISSAQLSTDFLKSIYAGNCKIPDAIARERDNQLKLREIELEAPKSITKNLFDLTSKLKDALLEANNNYNDDLTIIGQRHVTPLEKKRDEFYTAYWQQNKSLLQLDHDYKIYKRISDARKKLAEEVKAKKELSSKKALILDLSPADAQKVEETLKRNDDGILAKKKTIQVTVRDVKTLAPARWLNDTIVEFFMQNIEATTPKTVAFNSFFYTNLSDRGYSGVRRWLKKKKAVISELDKVFVPINLNQSHWALGLIDIPKKRIVYADSLSHGPNAMSFAILHDLQNYVIEESNQKLGHDFELAHIECPQQSNGYDCGIYVCMNTLFLSREHPLDFTSKDAAPMRKYILHLILNSSDKT